MNLYDLTDALIDLALAQGLPARLDYVGGGYEVLWINGVELVLERTSKAYALAAYHPDSLESEQIASGPPGKLLEAALRGLARFQDKLRAVAA